MGSNDDSNSRDAPWGLSPRPDLEKIAAELGKVVDRMHANWRERGEVDENDAECLHELRLEVEKALGLRQ